ncbi:atrial natriuretic peptide clearance receptor-like protein 1 [Sarcoptes scabiei]|uniref:Atrial natriuretic peptide clearance receptor-like protein 1 n=1 Tax=Sarcoptes scabiei TaxID=52283 RepID=A0A131ZVP0_SARSC|nr:atrial natriuretic peptide clearance receptor-like protein 1 [Sarcoptes scabiei]
MDHSNVTLLLLMSDQSELPVEYELVKATLQLSLEDLRPKYPRINFNLLTRKDPRKCFNNVMAGMAAEYYYLDRINAIIGPICSKGLDSVARLASHWNLPLITAGGVGVEFSNKNTFKSLTRLSFSLGFVLI